MIVSRGDAGGRGRGGSVAAEDGGDVVPSMEPVKKSQSPGPSSLMGSAFSEDVRPGQVVTPRVQSERPKNLGCRGRHATMRALLTDPGES